MTDRVPDPGQKWLIVVNPNAGVKKGARDWPRILKLLGQEGVDHEYVLTEHRGHAIHLTREFISRGFRNFAVVGGDGTLNEVVNGIFSQHEVPVSEFTVGMIPVGTGNDWCRSFGIPFDYSLAIGLLRRKKTTLQDAAKVTYEYKGERLTRWFINVAGMGYDALVAKKTNILKEKGRGGPLIYLYFVFASLFQFRFMDAVIEVDGRTEFKGEIFSMNVGVCKYSGGGMMQVPFAVPDDGLLDVTLIRKASKWVVVRYARKLYDGSLVDLPIVSTFRGKTIRIRSTDRIFLETDGESLGHTPFTYEVSHRCLRVVTGD